MAKRVDKAPTLPEIRSGLMASFSADQIADIATWIRLGGIERQSSEVLALAKECQQIADTPRSAQKAKPARATAADDAMSQKELKALIQQQLRDNLARDLAEGQAQMAAEAQTPKDNPKHLDHKALAQARHRANERMKHVG